MATEWRITQKPDFYKALLALPPKEMHQIIEKVNLLAQDPTPDAKVKKQLKYMNGRLHRIRCGDYRIFYTFEYPYISILALRRRDDDTYDEDLDVEFLGGLDPQFEDMSSLKAAQSDWEKWLAPKEPEKRRLPESITKELLANLHIPQDCHVRLLSIQTREDLLDCPGVPDDYLLLIDEYMFERPLVQVLKQPDYLLIDIHDLLRYKEGELLGFLLKLSPEQEKYVNWGMKGSGPTLLKGGPGTGKSTVALYRVRSIVQELRKKGLGEFRILFTTYTNALVKSSEQLLQQLLGQDARYVRVQTADKLAYDILQHCGQVKEIIENEKLHSITRQAVAEITFDGNALQQLAQKQTLERMGYNYLQQEINMVIVARQVNSLQEYLDTPRAGRKMALNPVQRRAVWTVYQCWRELMQASGRETWEQRRARAETLVEQSHLYHFYDAVVIDEAQDLDPTLLRLLVNLCASPNHIFVTADANQSIYGSGFTWADVHHSLKFQGRTSILRANYRSTREIGEAAQSYLTYGALEPETAERLYVNNGPMPDVRAVLNSYYEAQLLASFFKKASLNERLAIGSCAVLCPNERAGRAIAAALTDHNLEATYMTGQDLNLSRPGVKVLTLNAAKGLEFPVVALAGFVSSSYPIIPHGASEDERNELLARERRTMFVGMTRAMRALLVVVPVNTTSPLFQGFDPAYWNLSRKI